MSDEVAWGDLFNRVPAELIEAEMEAILSQEHGLDGVRVFVDRKSPRFTCSGEISDELKGRVFASAVKRLIIKMVREQ